MNTLLTIILAVVFLWLLPVILIAKSPKTFGVEKLLWIVAVLFVSWFSWIFYLILAPINKRD